MARGTGGLQLVGYGLIVAGGWLLNSAYRNRAPLATLQKIVKDPASGRSTLQESAGTLGANLPTINSSTVTPTSYTVGSSVAGPGAAAVLAWARAQIGKPYKLGATGPDAFDCSGLVQQAYLNGAGIKLPRTTQFMIGVGQKVTRDQLAIGDLVFPDAGHVQLYSGGGNVVEAPRPGKMVREVQMWGFLTARRVITPSGVSEV